MIDFDEELAKFTPSLEVDEVEDEIYKNDLTDVGDFMREIIEKFSKGKR